MKDYIWKFLAVILSLNLFLSGIASSMMKMPKILENIIMAPIPKDLYDSVTHEKIPIGGIDKVEMLSDGTVLHYVSRETIKKNVEKYASIVEKFAEERKLREDKARDEFFSPWLGLTIGWIGSLLSHYTDSNVPLYIGSVLGYAPGTYALVRNIYREIYGGWDREAPGLIRPSPRDRSIDIGSGPVSSKIANYPYGIVIVQRPEGKNKQFGVQHSRVYCTNSFYKDKLIKEINKGY